MIDSKMFYSKLFKDNDKYSKYALLGHHTYYDKTTERYITAEEMFDLNFSKEEIIYNSEIAEQGQLNDLYVSVNSIFLYEKQRNKKAMRSLNAFVLDYDYYKNPKYEELSAEEMYHNHIKETLLFEPTFVVDSGRGLYIIYTFAHSSNKHTASFYEKIWARLIEQQQEYDFMVDNQVADTTQVIRLVGSYNSKSNTKVSVIEYVDTEYKLNDFESVLPQSKEEYLKEKTEKDIYYNELRVLIEQQNKDKDVRITNSKKRNYFRRSEKLLNDFKVLATMERSDNRTFRRLMCYYLAYQLLWEKRSESYTRNVVNSLNKRFKVPLSDNEIESHCMPSQIFNNQFGKRTMMNGLLLNDLSAEEIKQLKYLIDTEKENEEYLKKQFVNKRNILGRTKKQQALFERRTVVFEMLLKNIRQKEIAEELNTSKQNISNDVKYIRENRHLFKEPYRPINDTSIECLEEHNIELEMCLTTEIDDTSPPPFTSADL